MQFYTTGYTCKRQPKKPEQLKALASTLNAHVADIRWWPHSKWAKHWERDALAQLLGDRYIWVKDLGNEGFKTHAYKIHNLERGIVLLETLALSSGVIILCGCEDSCVCHRTVCVGSELKRRGHKVIEIEDWASFKLAA